MNVSTASTNGPVLLTRRHRYLLFAATGMTYLLITWGGIVCLTESGRGCPGWPGCYGQIIPPPRVDSIIEYTHRLIAALTTPFIVAAAVVGWKESRSLRWISRPPAIAIVFLAAVITFGALAVSRGISPATAAVDLGSALMVLALVTVASVAALVQHGKFALVDQPACHDSFTRLTLWALIDVFIILVSGVLVSAGSSPVRCLGWPLYDSAITLADWRGWLQLARFTLTELAGISLVSIVVQAWRTRREQPALVRAAMAVGILFLAELVFGTLILTLGATAPLLVLSAMVTVALWGGLVALMVLAGVRESANQRIDESANRPSNDSAN